MIRVGDKVWILSTSQFGIVLSIDHQNRNYVVDVGADMPILTLRYYDVMKSQ